MFLTGLTRQLYLAPDDPAGAGAPPAPPAPPPTKTYSQQEKDADEAKLRRKYEREAREAAQAAKEREAELEAKLNAPTPPAPPTPAPGTPPADPQAAGNLEIMEARWKREREEQQRQLDEVKELAEKEKQTRLNLQRDQLLDNALRQAGVQSKHMLQARRNFLPQIEWDKVDEKWMYRTQKGNLVEILDGVAEELPDNLKPSRMPNGGAGNTGGIPASKQAKHRELEAAKQTLAQLKEKHRLGGGKQSDLAAFTAQKRVVDSLERGLNALK